MAIERLLRQVITIGSLALAAPFVAPALLTYTVMQQDLATVDNDEPPAKPTQAVAKPSAPAPLPPAPAVDNSSGPRTVTLRAGPHGGFSANPIINGHAVKAVVDTGATSVAISSETAKRLGVTPGKGDYDVIVATANGVTQAAQVTLREVKVGDIVLRNVDAVVIPGFGLDTTLLGMSFLKRLSKFEMSGGRLVLTQ